MKFEEKKKQKLGFQIHKQTTNKKHINSRQQVAKFNDGT